MTLSSLTVTAATVPLLLHGLSLLIATWLNIQQGWAALLVAIGTAALAFPAAGFGVVCLRRGFDSFRTSREELKRNRSGYAKCSSLEDASAIGVA